MTEAFLKYNKVIVLSDSRDIAAGFVAMLSEIDISEVNFSFFSTDVEFVAGGITFNPLLPKNNLEFIISDFNLLLSLHCKQIIPSEIIEAIKCINLHPGYNPYNRGWYPHVFSLVNGLPAGATIHEMDNKIDNGPVIARKEVPMYAYDTSFSLYNRVVAAELQIVKDNIVQILKGNYVTTDVGKGNLNTKKDYENLCRINLNEPVTYKQAFDRLRALSHGDYNNAWFIDEPSGKKCFVKLDFLNL